MRRVPVAVAERLHVRALTSTRPRGHGANLFPHGNSLERSRIAPRSSWCGLLSSGFPKHAKRRVAARLAPLSFSDTCNLEVYLVATSRRALLVVQPRARMIRKTKGSCALRAGAIERK